MTLVVKLIVFVHGGLIFVPDARSATRRTAFMRLWCVLSRCVAKGRSWPNTG
jgi:hypothetical protein